MAWTDAYDQIPKPTGIKPTTELEQWNFRRFVTARAVLFLREAIMRNGDIYSGSLVPNIQTLSDFLVMKFDLLWEHASKIPCLMSDQMPDYDQLLRETTVSAEQRFHKPVPANAKPQ